MGFFLEALIGGLMSGMLYGLVALGFAGCTSQNVCLRRDDGHRRAQLVGGILNESAFALHLAA